jgi:hypothetical protein
MAMKRAKGKRQKGNKNILTGPRIERIERIRNKTFAEFAGFADKQFRSLALDTRG